MNHFAFLDFLNFDLAGLLTVFRRHVARCKEARTAHQQKGFAFPLVKMVPKRNRFLDPELLDGAINTVELLNGATVVLVNESKRTDRQLTCHNTYLSFGLLISIFQLQTTVTEYNSQQSNTFFIDVNNLVDQDLRQLDRGRRGRLT